MDKMTFFEAQKWAFSFINEHHKETSAAEMLLTGQFGWSTTELLMHYRDEMPKEQFEIFKENIKAYCFGKPAQYILGKAHFFGEEFKVTPATLIPRQETEELVEWILRDKPKKEARVLDIGTGTGAIGLSLKNERPDLFVTLSDISAEALNVAKTNARILELEVELKESDLFVNIDGKFDVIVSNPPYIAESEVCLMDESVLKYEPKTALFAPDEGLYLYKRIAKEIAPYLNENARLYLEIGLHQGKSVVSIFKQAFPTARVDLKQDINGHDRMVRVIF